MKPTQRESLAVQHLARALLEFVIAHEEGRVARRAERPREEVAVRVEHVHPAPKEDAAPPRREAPERGFMNAKQAAEYLSIGERLLWSMTAPRGPLPSVRLGKAVRYPVGDLEATLQRMRSKPRRESAP
jgi:hypothetical protein